MELIEKSKINGFMKLYQSSINQKLKILAGIKRTVDNGLLFRFRKNFGLGLTSVSQSLSTHAVGEKKYYKLHSN